MSPSARAPTRDDATDASHGVALVDSITRGIRLAKKGKRREGVESMWI